MSRCFPYPPPGYCRNGAAHEALIESIKLQKESEREKAERRKERKAKKEKKEKKKEEKEKRKNDEKSKLQKNQSQDFHKLQKEAGFTEAEIKGKKTSTEVLERSDLTEEYGQPIKQCYSSDSTQNSNKRRRDDDDDALLPDDSTGHGKHIKIRLLKKHKGSDPSNSGEDARLKTVPLAPSSNLDRPLLVSSNRNNGVPATSGREINAAVQGIPLTQTKSNKSSERTKDSNPNGLRLGREQFASGSSAKQILPSGSRKSDVEVLKSRQQQQQQFQRQHQQIANFVRPVVPQAQSHLKHEIPSTSASRNIGVHTLNSVRHQPGPNNVKPAIPDPVLNKPNPVPTGKRPISEISAPLPGTSALTKAEKKNDDPKKAGPSRSEKKMMKKHAKYEKLMGSWVPPVFQALLPDDGVDADEDWLSRKTKAAKTSIPMGEVESCRELAATSLWQPHARYLAEADIHALPYTVPF